MNMNSITTTNSPTEMEMKNNENNNNEKATLESKDRASTEAGAIRGLTRSLPKGITPNAPQAMISFPVLGRLPLDRTVAASSNATATATATATAASTAATRTVRVGIPKPAIRPPQPSLRLPTTNAATTVTAKVASSTTTTTTKTTTQAAAAAVTRHSPPRLGGNSGSMSIQSVPKSAPGRSPMTSSPSSSSSPIPVQKVAKLSDRVSTGLGVYDTAQETGVTSFTWNLYRWVPFAISMVKNTLLGAAVFETYCFTVEYFASSPLMTPIHIPTNNSIHTNSNSNANTITHHDQEQWNPTVTNTTNATLTTSSPTAIHEQDSYARVSTSLHAVAGGLGGSLHGIVGTVWDTVAARDRTKLMILPRMTLHHGMAHAALFGSYESLKRQCLRISDLDSQSHQGAPYLGSVFVAGGISGQVQHVWSHYTEQWLRLEEGALTLPMEEASSTTIVSRLDKLWSARPPVLRSVLMAFPASAIGFIAFEYGRSLAVTTIEET